MSTPPASCRASKIIDLQTGSRADAGMEGKSWGQSKTGNLLALSGICGRPFQ